MPANYTFGDLGRNALRADRYVDLDFSAVRNFPVGESRRFQFRADMFNVANHPVWGTPGETLNSSQFGTITSTRSTERQIQFAAKFFF